MKTYILKRDVMQFKKGSHVTRSYWEGKGEYMHLYCSETNQTMWLFLRGNEPDPKFFKELKPSKQ